MSKNLRAYHEAVVWKGYKFVYSHKSTQYIWALFYMLYNLIVHHNQFGHLYLVDDKRKCVYYVVPKGGCTSLFSVFSGETSKDKRDVIEGSMGQTVKMGLYKKSLFSSQKGYFKFSFVRNPLSRLVSAYESKYHKDKVEGRSSTGVLDFDIYLCGYIKKDKGFDNFIRKITKLPHCLDNGHFASQYKMLYGKNGCLVDYIGHFENLSNDFAPIAKKYDFPQLPHFNKTEKSRDWRDYYTLELAELVYNKYRQDFETFGYQDSYNDLVKYLQEKEQIRSVGKE